jgi:hypothetical protein
MCSSRPALLTLAVNIEFFVSGRLYMGFTRRLERGMQNWTTLCCHLDLQGVFQNQQSTPRVKEVSN